LINEKLYTVSEAADLLAMHPETVRRLIRASELRPEKLGPRQTRIPGSELLRFRRERSERYRR
jgi:excisionase family DNA binding protein